MLRLIKAEKYKMFNSTIFKILCIVSFILAISTVVIFKFVLTEEFLESSLSSYSEEAKETLIYDLNASGNEDEQLTFTSGFMGIHISSKDTFNATVEEVYYSSFGNGVVEIYIIVLVIGVMLDEYSKNTLKNTLAYGVARWKLYIAKLIALLIGITILLSILVGLTTILYGIFNGDLGIITESMLIKMIRAFISAVVVSLIVITAVMLISTIIKKTSIVVLISIVIFIIIPVSICGLYGKNEIFNKVFSLTSYYNLANVTFLYANNLDIIKSVIISLVISAIMILIGIKVFKTQDIK